MIYKKIIILKSSPYKPKKGISSKNIRKPFKVFLNKLKNKNFNYNGKDELGDIKLIAKFFKVKVRFLKEFDYKGEFDYKENLITIRINSKIKKIPYTKKQIRATFTHELSHLIQKRVNVFKDKKLSDCLMLEQEAESAAYELCKIFYPKLNFSKKLFNSYFKENDIIYLGKYYKNYALNDLFKWRKK